MKHLIIGTAGHIDHGKTSLVKALTQIDCDTHREEKRRGITINLGFAHLELGNSLSAGIVDVPGHKNFIETMVSGAAGIDLVLMVIAADSGIMPQTREHLGIIQSLGIKKGLIALTKCDLVDEDFIELARLEIEEELQGSILEHAPIIPVSAHDGRGLEELKTALSALAEEVEEKPAHGFFRMYIDRLFSIAGHGSVVTGSVINGQLRTGEEVFLFPGKQKLNVRSIQRHGQTSEGVVAGDRAAINLPGLDRQSFERGMVLCTRELESTHRIDVSITFYNGKKPLPKHSTVLFLSGTFRSLARVHLLDNAPLSSGETALAQIETEYPAYVFTADHFIIRNSSNDSTLGGGMILDHNPLKHRKPKPSLLERLKEIQENLEHKKSFAALLANEVEKRQKPVSIEELVRFFNLNIKPNKVLEKALQNQQLYLFGKETKIVVPLSVVIKTEEQILNAIKTFHNTNPLSDKGLYFNDLIGKCKLDKSDVNRMFLLNTLNRLVHNNQLIRSGEAFASPDFVLKIDKQTAENLDWLEAQLLAYGMQKPVVQELELKAAKRRIRSDDLQKLLKYLVKKQKVYFSEGDYIHASVVDKSRKILVDHLLKTGRGVNEGEFRVLIDGTKKIIHPLVRIFVSEGIVRQDGFIIYHSSHPGPKKKG